MKTYIRLKQHKNSVNISGVGEMGVGETVVGEMGQIICEMGVGEMVVGKTGTSQNSTPKHKTIRTTTEVCLGTISNIKLLGA